MREVFSAQSPDELALVNAAKAFGMRFRSRPSQRAIIIEQDLPVNAVTGSPASTSHQLQMQQYELLEIIEFSSTRKRMSVIVKDLKKSQIKILTKGADDVVGELLAELDMDSYEGQRQA